MKIRGFILCIVTFAGLLLLLLSVAFESIPVSEDKAQSARAVAMVPETAAIASSSKVILFLDLNGSLLEIESARKAARLRGESLLVLPEDAEKWKRRDRDGRALFGAYNSQSLLSDLKALAPHVQIQTVLISGHDGAGSMMGVNGYLTGEGMRYAFKEFKGSQSVKAIHLLGCWSAAPDVIGAIWKAAFPNAAFIGGYDNIGYLNHRPEAHIYIERVLAREREIYEAPQISEAASILATIAPSDARHTFSAQLLDPQLRIPVIVNVGLRTKSIKPLKDALGCKAANELLAEITKYMTCVQNEQIPAHVQAVQCPISLAEKHLFTIHGKCEEFGESRFSPEQKAVADHYKDFLFRLAHYSYGGERSRTSYEVIFEEAPRDLYIELGLGANLKSYKELKEKILRVKYALDARLRYSHLRWLTAERLVELANAKVAFDKAWLEVSNFNRYQYHGPENMVHHSGVLRAQSFYNYVREQRQERNLFRLIDQRLRELKAKTTGLEGEIAKSEIAALELFLIEP